MNFLNYICDNDIIFYGMFVGVVCHLGLSFLSSIQHGNKVMTETGVQTDAVVDLSNGPSQIIPDNPPSIETLTPVTPAFEDTSTITPTQSQVGTPTIAADVNVEVVPNLDIVGTPTIAADVNVEVVPNLDIVGTVVDPSNAEYIAARVDQLNALDPFSATP
jgi:hypothetical protein